MRKILSVTLILSLFIQKNINAQITGATALYTLNTLENKAKNLISDFEGGANDIVNNAGLNIMNAIREFKEAYGSSLDKTEKVLDRQVENIFNELRSSINATFNNLERSLNQVDHSIDNLASVIGRIPGINKDPKITQLNIPIVVSRQHKDIILSFKGAFLNNKRNYLTVDGRKAYIRQMTDHLIDFRAPFSLNTNDCEQELPVTLYLHKKKKPKIYRFVVKVIPQEIATIEVTYNTRDNTIKRYNKEYKASAKVGGPGIGGGRRTNKKDVRIYPTPDRIIDIHSVRVKTDVRSGRGDCKDKFRITPSGISARIEVKSDSHPGGRGGKCSCTYKYTEIESGTKSNTATYSDKLYYNASLTIPLPSNTAGVKYIKVSYCDGTQRTITNFSYSDYPLFQLSYSKTSKVVVITPNLN